MQHKTIDSESGAETTGPSPDGGVETADPMDDTVAPVSPAAASDEQPEAASPPGEDHAEPVEVGRVPMFLHEIARTMQAAADREREQIAAEMADSLSAHVERVRSRASTEAEELKRLAEDDVNHIREWSAVEAERLRQETDSRIGARRENLDRDLRQHDTLVEREISQAGVAVEEYRGELDRFVGRLASEREPTEIARLASLLPEPPASKRSRRRHGLRRSHNWRARRRPPIRTAAGHDLLGVMDPSVIAPVPLVPRPRRTHPLRPLTPALRANKSARNDAGESLVPGTEPTWSYDWCWSSASRSSSSSWCCWW